MIAEPAYIPGSPACLRSRRARSGPAWPGAHGQARRCGPLNEIGVDDLDFARPIVLAGRTPNPERSDEVVINPAAAEHAKLHVGSSLRFRAFGREQAQELLRGTTAPPTGPIVTVRVVGIVRFPADLSVAPATPDVTYTGNDGMFFTRAFRREVSRPNRARGRDDPRVPAPGRRLGLCELSGRGRSAHGRQGVRRSRIRRPGRRPTGSPRHQRRSIGAAPLRTPGRRSRRH